MARGNLRIYMGAATGAGTTYAMLEEALRRQSRGADIIVGCVDTDGRPTTTAKLHQLVGGDFTAPTELHLDEVLERRPAVVLVDQLAATNRDGSRNRHRWRDVDELLDAGIDVISTITVQQVESLADPVRQIVGTAPDATVPDRFLAAADQIELIDIAPEAMLRRIAHGNVFAPGTDPAASQLFTSDEFAQLRALMLFWMADHVASSQPAAGSGIDIRERVVVALSGAPTGDALVRRAARLAQRSRAELVGVHVHVPSGRVDPAGLARQRALLSQLGGTFRQIEAGSVAGALVAFANTEAATQLVIGTSGSRGSVVGEVLSMTPSADVLMVSHEPDSTSRRRPHLHLAPPVISRRRRLVAFIGGAALLATMTVLMVAWRDDITVATSLTLYLLAVVGISALGGWLPGLTAAVAAPLLTNWFLIEPYHTLRIDDPENALELAVFVSVAVVVSAFVSIAARRTSEAEQALREAASLATLAGSVGPDALQLIADQLCETFALAGVAVLDISHQPVERVATSGQHPPLDANDADFAEPLGEHAVLAVRGGPLTAEELRVLHVFVQQLSSALERQQMAELAAESDALARADELRTAILRAVSHDLRSPLAGIKASVSSLRQPDVDWPDDVRDDFLASIEDETDRLTTIVTNLLDMSRLQAGVLAPAMRPVALEEVVPAALHSLGIRSTGVDLALPADLPDVLADPALLERVLANLVSNAVEFSPPSEPVRVTASPAGDGVRLYVIDHGRGIQPRQRELVLQPFHRLSDSTANSGVGLGLAIASGLTEAMGGRLELQDTPGGGLTVVVSLLTPVPV